MFEVAAPMRSVMPHFELMDRRSLERDDFSSNRHPARASYLSMIFSENRHPLFGIML